MWKWLLAFLCLTIHNFLSLEIIFVGEVERDHKQQLYPTLSCCSYIPPSLTILLQCFDIFLCLFSSGKYCYLFISYFLSNFYYIFFIIVFRAEILDGDKSLVIKNVLPSDEGTYICEAHNSVGQISSKAQLIVNCKYLLFLLCVDYFWGQSIRVLKI